MQWPKKNKRQTMIHNALYRKLKSEQHEIHYKRGDFRSSGRTVSFFSTSGTCIVTLAMNPMRHYERGEEERIVTMKHGTYRRHKYSLTVKHVMATTVENGDFKLINIIPGFSSLLFEEILYQGILIWSTSSGLGLPFQQGLLMNSQDFSFSKCHRLYVGFPKE
jgi:hypothetical protein